MSSTASSRENSEQSLIAEILKSCQVSASSADSIDAASSSAHSTDSFSSSDEQMVIVLLVYCRDLAAKLKHRHFTFSFSLCNINTARPPAWANMRACSSDSVALSSTVMHVLELHSKHTILLSRRSITQSHSADDVASQCR